MATEYKLSFTATEIDERLGMVSQLSDTIGDLENLETTEKGSLIAAINEVATSQNSGGNVDQVSIEPAEDDIPQVYLTGVDGVSAPTTKAEGEVNFRLHYVSKSEEFTAYCTLKLQGDSSASASYKKKNYTVKMFSDSAHESKLKKEFRDWGFSTNKYILKANWIDATHARQMVAYDIWSKIVQTREGYADSVEATLPNQGTSDGFPVIVYINDTYYGIYTWILPKSDTLFGVNEDDASQFVLYGQTNTNGTFNKTANNFRSLWNGTDGNNWEIEVGTNSDIVKTAVNDFTNFVMTATDEEFYANLNDYCDVDALIDDYLYEYYICGIDALAQNMILICRDGKRFTMGVWDRDSTFGLWWNGASMVSATYRCPEDYQEKFSLLWARLEGTFYNELKARKAELRADGAPLSFANIVGTFDKFVHNIGDDRYDENNAAYTQPSKSIATKKQFREFVRDRLVYVDSCVDSFGTVIKCADISLSESAVEISEGNHTLTAVLVPGATTQEVTWESSNANIATVSGGVITPRALGSTTITAKCGQYSATCAVTVSGIAEIPCTGINLDKSTLTFTAEGTQTITATATPVGCTDVMVWVSSNPSVAAISVDGAVCTVEAITNGNATITVTCGEYSASCDVSVSGIAEPVPCTGISLDKTELTFNGDGTKTITATVTPSDTTDIVVWSVNPAGIVSVVNGVVTALANGSCTITATCGGQSTSCAVNVSGVFVAGDVDYSYNPLANAVWVSGEEVVEATGEIRTKADTDRTEKIEVQQNCSCVMSGGQYNKLSIWDKDDNYVGQVYRNNVGICLPVGYKFIIQAWNGQDGFSRENISFTPEDNSASATYQVIDLSEITWTGHSGQKCLEGTLATAVGKVDSSNYPFAAVSGGSILGPTTGGKLLFGIYNNSLLIMRGFGDDVEAANAYFAEHGTKLILNARQA